MNKLFGIYIDRDFIVLVFFGLKISIKLKELQERNKNQISYFNNELEERMLINIERVIETKNYVMVNLGCGGTFDTNWINIDYNPHHKEVFKYNLNNGIPIGDNKVDAVYGSHVLEHFSKTDAINFLKSCLRVLKPGGVLRVVVPDLEEIVRLYLNKLEEKNEDDYDWMMLELFDQTVRNVSGGGYERLFVSG